MKVIIAGGSGFIGTALTRELAKEGNLVTILTRRQVSLEPQSKPSVTYLQWDGQSLGDWVSPFNASQVVINLAGENIAGKNFYEVVAKRWTKQRKEILRSSRVNTGLVLTSAIQTANQHPATFIQASAVGYYGQHPNCEFTEVSPPGNDFLAQLCVDWENSSAEVESQTTKRIIIRIAGIVMSDKGGSLPFLLFPYKYFIGGPLGSGKQWVSWIHLDDLVRSIIFLINNPTSQGVYNLCAPQTITNQELCKIIGKVMKRPSAIRIPEWVFRIGFGEKANTLLASQKQIPIRLLEDGFQFKFPDVDSALENILVKADK